METGTTKSARTTHRMEMLLPNSTLGDRPLDSRIYWAYTPGVALFPDHLAECAGFQWDAGNAGKNWELHQVSNAECEQVFFNRPILVAPDEKQDRKSTRLNSSHIQKSRMPSSA